MTGRREVRVTDQFFEDLDSQLGDERGPNGEPSATDFLVLDVPAIIQQFATNFDTLAAAYPSVPAVRVAVGTGILVRAFAVYGLELDDGSIELVAVDIDV